MEYAKANEIINNNQHLIGKTFKGGRIDDLVIHPTDRNSHDEFTRSYIYNRNGAAAIQPFTKEDVDIYAIIDSGRINAHGVFLHASLGEISNEHQVNL